MALPQIYQKKKKKLFSELKSYLGYSIVGPANLLAGFSTNDAFAKCIFSLLTFSY